MNVYIEPHSKFETLHKGLSEGLSQSESQFLAYIIGGLERDFHSKHFRSKVDGSAARLCDILYHSDLKKRVVELFQSNARESGTILYRGIGLGTPFEQFFFDRFELGIRERAGWFYDAWEAAEFRASISGKAPAAISQECIVRCLSGSEKPFESFDEVLSHVTERSETELAVFLVRAVARIEIAADRDQIFTFLSELAQRKFCNVRLDSVRAEAVKELILGWPERFELADAQSWLERETNTENYLKVIASTVRGYSITSEHVRWLEMLCFEWSDWKIPSVACFCLEFYCSEVQTNRKSWAYELLKHRRWSDLPETGYRVLAREYPCDSIYSALINRLHSNLSSVREHALHLIVRYWKDDNRVLAELKKLAATTDMDGHLPKAIATGWSDQSTLEFLKDWAARSKKVLGVVVPLVYQIEGEDALEWIEVTCERHSEFSAISQLPISEGNVNWLEQIFQRTIGSDDWITAQFGFSGIYRVAKYKSKPFRELMKFADRIHPQFQHRYRAFVFHDLIRDFQNDEVLEMLLECDELHDLGGSGVFTQASQRWPNSRELIALLQAEATKSEDYEEGCGCDNRSFAWEAIEYVAAFDGALYEWIIEICESNFGIEIRGLAVEALRCRSGAMEKQDCLLRLFENRENREFDAIVFSLLLSTLWGPDDSAEFILKNLHSRCEEVRERAILALVNRTDIEGQRELLVHHATKDQNRTCRFFAISGLSRQYPDEVTFNLLRFVVENDVSPFVQEQSIERIAKWDESLSFLKSIVEREREFTERLQGNAIVRIALRFYGDPDVRTWLAKIASEHSRESVRKACLRNLSDFAYAKGD